MTQGIAISSITTWAADNALASAALITASEHNTHRGNVRTDAANKLLAIQDLETSSAGTSAPTDKPIGKFWFDSTNLLMQWYEVSAGTLRVAVSRDKAETLSSKTLSSPTITGNIAKDVSVITNSAETFLIGGVIHLDPATVTRAGATGVLSTYTLPAATLAVDKQAVRITAWGTKSGTAATATLQFRFNAGAQKAESTTSATTRWHVTWLIVRTGAATQDFYTTYIDDNSAPTRPDHGTDAETLANALAIDINVSAINAADTITQEGMIVEFLNFA